MQRQADVATEAGGQVSTGHSATVFYSFCTNLLTWGLNGQSWFRKRPSVDSLG